MNVLLKIGICLWCILAAVPETRASAVKLPLVVDDSHIDEQLMRLDAEVLNFARSCRAGISRVDSMRHVMASRDSVMRRDYVEMSRLCRYLYPDSAIIYTRKAIGKSIEPDDTAECRLLFGFLTLLPSRGFIKEAVDALAYYNIDAIPEAMRSEYLKASQNIYAQIARRYFEVPEISDRYKTLAVDARRKYMLYFNAGDCEYEVAEAMNYFDLGNYVAAYTAGVEVLERIEEKDPDFASLSIVIAEAYGRKGRNREQLYYLVRAAISHLKCVMPQGTALQRVGHSLYESGDIDRAHGYMSAALENATLGATHADAHVMLKSMSLMDRSYNEKMRHNERLVWIIAGISLALMAVICVELLRYRYGLRRLKAERHKAEGADRARLAYVKNFLELCVSTSRRLNSLCRLVGRKISANQVEQLYDYTRSGRIIEEQRREVLSIFDKAFLGLYPDFIERLNSLLREEERYPEPTDCKLPTELRIYAFFRLGIDDCNYIADFLCYSINTIYAYKAKVRAKAISKDMFDKDFMDTVVC